MVEPMSDDVDVLAAPELAAVNAALGTPGDKAPDKDRVFIIRGRDPFPVRALIDFLAKIGLKPTEWSQVVTWTRVGSPTIQQVLRAGFRRCWAVVALFTPDDFGELRWPLRDPYRDGQHELQPTGQARLNVVFEAGAALALMPNRTVLVEFGRVRPLSDLDGYLWIRIGEDNTWRGQLAEALRACGCQVDTTGTEWHHAGDLSARIRQRASEWNSSEGDRGWSRLLDRVELEQARATGIQFDATEVAYAALSAAQHGHDLDYWTTRLYTKPLALPYVVEFIANEHHHVDPRLRAAAMVECLPADATKTAIDEALQDGRLDEFGRTLLTAVQQHTLRELIEQDLKVDAKSDLLSILRLMPDFNRVRLIK